MAMSRKPLIAIYCTEEENAKSGYKKVYLDRVRQYFQVVSLKQLDTDRSMISQIEGAIISPSRYIYMKPYLKEMTSLKVVTSISTGMDTFPVHEFVEIGVKVGYAPCNRQQNKTIADYAMLLLLSLARDFVTELGYREGKLTATYNRLSHDVTNKTLGIIGLGRIGNVLADRARAFDMNVLYHNRSERSDKKHCEYHQSLHTMLPKCDYVAVCCPNNEQSYHMLSFKEFGIMKSTAMVVNISRGKVIDTDALVDALHSGKIAGAGLDVTNPEPLPEGHPLLTLPNVIVTSHAASHTFEAKDEVWQMVIDNLKAGTEGKPLPYEYHKETG